MNEENSKEADEKAEVDYNLLPQLLITEIMPNNDGGADDYEYFEVYNNSNQPIIVDHYTIALRYTDGSGNPDVPFVFDPVTVQPSQTLVFWRNNANKSLDDFNNYYQASLTAQDVVEYDGAEFYNSGNRGVVVKNKENEMVSVNYLPEDISSGRVVEYTHPTSGTEMKTYQTVTDPSPGSIKEEQLPAQVVDVPENAEPVIDHQHLHKIEAGKDVTIEAKITDDHNDLDAKVFYKTIDEDTYNQLVMTKQEGGDAYQAVISANDIVADQMSYYVTVTDPNHRVTYPAPDKSIEVMNQPEIEEDTKAPEITHTPVAEVEALSSITIDATIVDNLAVPTATLFVKGEEDETFTALAMSPTASDTHSYSVEIPGFYVKSTMTYYIEATDGTNVSKTEEYTIKVRQEESNDDQVPELLVTEVVPDSANVGSADGYEFIEIYNNTNKPINFNDYKIQYRYGSDPESDVIWPSVPDDVVIPSKETLIFWIINGQNDNQTVEDFNANYGTSLVDNKDIVRIYSAGMANGSMRGLIVASNVGRELSIAYYNDVETQDDTHADKGILYKYPVDGSNMMEKVSAGLTAATPGSVESFQVPSETVTVPNDNVAPAIENMTEQTEVNQTDNIQLKADAKDDLEVKTVQVYYRTDDETDYQMALLEAGYDDMLFHHIIYSPEIIAKEYVEYYFVASDGINKTTSDVHKIKITNSLDVSSLRLNVDEGQIISGGSR
ncbi:hypothetical protein JCM21714_3701 [Gracilibacillus boraciitolerans JCM 21714]|uniref:LTD domain-containing protein n=1 Tax=Gracilibacillus boraciitolerans JCM 21714 TaxID=1298598 RepID=W4VP65_9BACI|nr:lamin tail domain-containing protein [Gracilibacillus boraciitolerans]GAE94539.1 hypothetical protein JCM21714_3701 [Gracilibacillus boraciitolerans JCM 21714]